MQEIILWFAQEIAPAIFGTLLIIGSFVAGFFIGKYKTRIEYLKTELSFKAKKP